MSGEPVFAALSDPTRRALLTRLSDGGPATATQLAAELPITRQAVVKHLEALREAQLVTSSPAKNSMTEAVSSTPSRNASCTRSPSSPAWASGSST